ncbi:hypothetical protein I350_04906 [Cryptococcus amylolentus CBS 6273]|uniref:BZIP domain-containing protein n=1 Tax=Cryptococcus amylolentus CBS 6273 TaxID=1296118 RepID=A0A1E3JYG4_9TREE|nr:hypothetical protein I350_04906 [Cryptococcus amylolentus CBS 6273]
MSTALLATPSPSIKRPSPATSSQTLKRPRHASVSFTDMGNDSGTSDNEGGDDERAKIARKEARVIRNRQSAQRSRNARKLHLQHLEKRVVELEAENQALKSNPKASPTPLVSHSTLPSASPAASSDLDMFSFAHDLGLPSQLVGGGVNLTSVAPPPADVKDSFEPSPLSLSPTMASTSEQVDSLQAENAALKQRVTLLENLVKQVVAVANLSGQSQPPANLSSQAPIDWLSVFTSPSAATTSGLSSTLSPGLPPTVSSFPTSHTNLASGDLTSRSLTREARCGPAAGEGGYFNAFFGGGVGEGREAIEAGGEGDCGAGKAAGLDITVPTSEYGSEQLEEFSGGEGAWAHWDEAMRVLVDGIEGGQEVKEEIWDGNLRGDLGLDLFGLESGIVA